MHSGQVKSNYYLVFFLCILSSSLISSCKNEPSAASSVSFKFPEQGQTVAIGKSIAIQLDVPQNMNLKSATYLIDGKKVAVKNTADSILIPTTNFSVGYKIITAIVVNGSAKDTITVNIVMLPGSKPELYSYKVKSVFPHDTSSYTQGLEYHDGRILESTGLDGSSTLRWVGLETGKTLQKADLDKKYFGEGSTLVGDKIVMLTWQNGIGLVFDAKTLVQKSSFPYQASREGWGLCFNGKELIKSDGSNRLYFLNKDTYEEERSIEVYDNDGPVNSLNELEYIEGKIYANVYTKDYIVVIDPNSGIVEKKIDLSRLLEKGYNRKSTDTNIDVLNGIAWDRKNNRLFVTGKKWPKLFEITLVPQ